MNKLLKVCMLVSMQVLASAEAGNEGVSSDMVL